MLNAGVNVIQRLTTEPPYPSVAKHGSKLSAGLAFEEVWGRPHLDGSLFQGWLCCWRNPFGELLQPFELSPASRIGTSRLRESGASARETVTGASELPLDGVVKSMHGDRVPPPHRS